MAVSFNAVTTHAGLGSNSYTHTPVGIPTAVLVALTLDNLGRNPSVTYGGQAMTLLKSVASPDVTTAQFLFGLSGPPSGAQTVSITISGTTQADSATMTVTGSATSSAFGVPISNSANSGNASGSLTIAGTGSLALAAVGNNQAVSPVAVAWSAASPGTERWNFLDANPFEDIAGQTSPNTGTINFSWTNNNTGTTSWGLIAVEILVPAPPPVPPTGAPMGGLEGLPDFMPGTDMKWHKWLYVHRGYLPYEKEATHWYNPETGEIVKL